MSEVLELGKFKFRCHSLGDLMTGSEGITTKQLQSIADYTKRKEEAAAGVPKVKPLTDIMEEELKTLIAKRDSPPKLADTCTKEVIKRFVEVYYGREYKFENKYILKGLNVEDSSIELYSKHRGEIFVKNKQKFSNAWLEGNPDILDYNGDAVDEVTDVKSSWDIFTFFGNNIGKLNKDYYWQLQGYMGLTGAKRARLAYCLINTPQNQINAEKIKLQRQMGTPEPGVDQAEYYAEAMNELEVSMRYDDVPERIKVIEIMVERNDADIASIYKRVEECRLWMKDNLVKLAPDYLQAS